MIQSTARARARCFCARQWLFILLVAAAIGSCDSGGDSGGEAAIDQYWVSVDPMTTAVSSSHVELRGDAYCDACPPDETEFGHCPPIQGPFNSAVDVRWSNLTTGESGNAFHWISGDCSCLFSQCTVFYSHDWVADVPLVMGENDIEVVAAGPSRAPDVSRITITRIPVTPEDVGAEGGYGEITLRWEPVAGASSYNILWSTSPDLGLPATQKIVGVASPFEHTGLSDDVTYYYAVTAVSDGYESVPSRTVWATSGWITSDLPVFAASWYPTDSSMDIDSLDYVHIFLSRREQIDVSLIVHNEYLNNRDGSFTSASVDTPAAASAAIAMDSHDAAHVSYLDFEGVVHAFNESGSWTSELVDNTASCVSSIALDSLDNVHLVYRDQSGGLQHASSASGAWVTETVDIAGPPCDPGTSMVSLALDADGNVHVAYLGASPGYGLQYATNNEGAWTYSTVATGYVWGPSLALDAEGTPHIAYVDDQSVLRHAQQEASGAWTIDTIDEATARSPSAAIDGNGNIHVGYWSASEGGQLRYATNPGGSWRIVRIDSATPENIALALDSLGRVHICYFDVWSSRYATNR